MGDPLAPCDDLLPKEYTTTTSNQKAIKNGRQRKTACVGGTGGWGAPRLLVEISESGSALGFFEATALTKEGVTGFGLFFLGSLGRRVVLDFIPCINAVRTVAIVFYHRNNGFGVNFA